MSKKLRLIIAVFFGLIYLEVGFASNKIVDALKTLEAKNDALGIRTVLRQHIKAKFNFDEWNAIRKILQNKQNVGFDLVFYWDRVGQTKFTSKKSPVEKLISSSDKLMLKKDFKGAGSQLMKAAKIVREDVLKGRTDHKILYYRILHNVGRALFGSGHFLRAMYVYEIIPQDYYDYRQVLFEKMWSAFRAKRYDVALGAIASQRSAYFSDYLDPESYLVQLYIYKNLCREEDIEISTNSLKRYLSALKDNTYDYRQWAKESIETSSLLNLIDQKNIEANPLANLKELLKEKLRVKRSIQKRFKIIKKQRIKRLNRVLGYSKLAIIEKTPSLKKVTELESPEVLRATGFEYWPVSDAEEWVDELGLHYFVGNSRCN